MHNALKNTGLNKFYWCGFLGAGLLVQQSANLYAQSAANSTNSPAAGTIQLVELQGQVQVARGNSKDWETASANETLHAFDRIRTGENSRVALRWSDQSVVPVGASSELEILPPANAQDQCGLHLVNGVLSFFHRDKPGHIRVITDGAIAGVEGTEFAMAAEGAQKTTLSVVDGRVRFGNDAGALVLTNGEQAVVEQGQAPHTTPGFIANNLLQWCFYYPAVINPDDLKLTAAEKGDLAASLKNYEAGDLLAALASYPTNRAGISDNEIVYKAALLLSVGQVDKTEEMLGSVKSDSGETANLAVALRELIAAVKRQPNPAATARTSASEQMAASYYAQSQAVREVSLKQALELAQQATKNAPTFGFAWERVAELEFSFGHLGSALTALDKSLQLSPRNAQALALKGFILSAQNRTKEAISYFDQAIAVDAALGNAWLGRGICKIHGGDADGGRQDLVVAAALEPQRSELRSYLGKAYAHSGDMPHAERELNLAKQSDPHDPTPWLYSALIKQEGNEINDSIRDLEKSQKLNDNRSVYRSQLLLDEDQAVRSANLAEVYLDAGMVDQSVREAGRAVSYDYGNYSAHLFLASSYNQLRDPDFSNLRYETPANSEYLIANLLAPPSAGTMSPLISEQAYSKLFDQNRLGVMSDSTYLGRGAWSEYGAQYGTYDNFNYDFEAKYVFDPGQRQNDAVENRDLVLNVKQALTSRDTISLSYESVDIVTGDNSQQYSQNYSNPTAYHTDKQNPNLTVGYRHEWAPGVQTLFLGSYRSSKDYFGNNSAGQYLYYEDTGQIQSIQVIGDIFAGSLQTDLYSTELQQIFEQPNHTTILGARYQFGFQRYTDFQTLDGTGSELIGLFNDPVTDQNLANNFHNLSFYGYHYWQLFDNFRLEAGAAYEVVHGGANPLSFPMTPDGRTEGQLSPKAGFIFTPLDGTTIRGAFTRGLAGYGDGDSFRIEPTEVAGINQAYRDLIPESLAGSTPGAKDETFDLSLEQKFDSGTYLGVAGEILYSRLNEQVGGFLDTPDPNQIYPYESSFDQNLDYHEYSLTFTADQLIGKQLTVGARYSVVDSHLDKVLPQIPLDTPSSALFGVNPWQHLDSTLNQVNFHANWNHPSGLFSSFDANWYHQDNHGFNGAEPGDDFWQLNVYAGYRFWHRRAEATVGILNLTDQNYQLEPLNFYNNLARERTVLARLLITF